MLAPRGAATRKTQKPAFLLSGKCTNRREKKKTKNAKSFLFRLLQRHTHTQSKGKKGREKQLEMNRYLVNRKDLFTEIYLDPRVQVIKSEKLGRDFG